MSALNTDLYELTMAAGYFAERKTSEIATFELSVRRLPEARNFLIAAGLAQAVEYLRELRFRPEEIDYLRGLAQFKHAQPEFFDFLAKLRFTGDLFALPEGTPVFANEPIAIVRAPLVEAQLVETFLLSTFMFQTMVASKAARCVHSGGAGGVCGRMLRHEQRGSGNAFRHSSFWDGGAFLDDGVRGRRARVPGATKATG
jgi:nicotinate phosphoribosyltransferase